MCCQEEQQKQSVNVFLTPKISVLGFLFFFCGLFLCLLSMVSLQHAPYLAIQASVLWLCGCFFLLQHNHNKEYRKNIDLTRTSINEVMQNFAAVMQGAMGGGSGFGVMQSPIKKKEDYAAQERARYAVAYEHLNAFIEQFAGVVGEAKNFTEKLSGIIDLLKHLTTPLKEHLLMRVNECEPRFHSLPTSEEERTKMLSSIVRGIEETLLSPYMAPEVKMSALATLIVSIDAFFPPAVAAPAPDPFAQEAGRVHRSPAPSTPSQAPTPEPSPLSTP